MKIKTVSNYIPKLIRIPLRKKYYQFTNYLELKRLEKLFKDNSFIKQGDLVFDIGANVGDYTKVFDELSEGKVVCVEPNPECYEILKQRFKSIDRITIFNAAVSNQKCERDFFIAEDNGHSTFNKSLAPTLVDKYTQTVKTKTITLRWLIDTYGKPDFIKVDVEGHEPEVLETLQEGDIKHLSFEMASHRDVFSRCIEILKKFKDLEYNFSSGSFKGEYHRLHLAKWVSLDELVLEMNKYISDPLFNSDIYVRKKNGE